MDTFPERNEVSRETELALERLFDQGRHFIEAGDRVERLGIMLGKSRRIHEDAAPYEHLLD